jgi:hypothetical protein
MMTTKSTTDPGGKSSFAGRKIMRHKISFRDSEKIPLSRLTERAQEMAEDMNLHGRNGNAATSKDLKG